MQLNSARGMQSFSLKEIHGITSTFNEDARALMTERANGRRTLPQIFIDNAGIGGCDDLYTLDNENKLDALLN